MNPSGKSRSKRPLWLKILAFSLLILAILGWMRFFESVVRCQEFIHTGMRPGPWYTAASGLVIGGLALAAALGIWLRARWAPWFTRITIVLWLAWMAVDRLIIASSPDALANWPFLAGAGILILAGIFVALQRGRDQFL